MCHQAAWVIYKSTDRSLQGHGPVWQQWMRDVGLPVEQFDRTDVAEYGDSFSQAMGEAASSRKYGKRATPAELRHLKPFVGSTPRDGDVYGVVFEGRLFWGTYHRATGFLEAVAPNGTVHIFSDTTISQLNLELVER
jgi:hypothetical protein